ncbi:MAG: hypothetical protein DRH76_04245 [Deltaproteobacteria bacterium]|nr:MAG: hypothetical protein DRH76_04245 [Deltaproteobacteria bacterium]
MFDPREVHDDAFAIENMIEGGGKVVMTDAERAKLAGVEEGTFKGYFNTPDDLGIAHPVGQEGWSAIILFENDGTTPNGNLWSWNVGTLVWDDTGVSGVGGDMAASVYDPTGVAGDVFALDNMVEGADVDKRFFDNTRKAKLDGLEEGSNYYDKTYIDTQSALKADTSYVNIELAKKMAITVYDPNTVNGDAFAMDNMVEGADAKILTAVERSAISDSHTHSNKAVIDLITDEGSGIIMTDTERVDFQAAADISHSHANKAVIDAITDAGSGLVITATERTAIGLNTTDRHAHTNKAVLDATTASYTTAEESKLAGLAPIAFLMGTAYFEGTNAQGLTTAFAKSTAALAMSAAVHGLVVKNTNEVGHNEAGKTFTCQVTVQVSLDKGGSTEATEISLWKNGARVAESMAHTYTGGNQDTSEHSATAVFTVDISSTDTIAAALRATANNTYTIYSVQISVTGFQI